MVGVGNGWGLLYGSVMAVMVLSSLNIYGFCLSRIFHMSLEAVVKPSPPPSPPTPTTKLSALQKWWSEFFGGENMSSYAPAQFLREPLQLAFHK